jgi:hypothetical protein
MSDWIVRAFATKLKGHHGHRYGDLLLQSEHDGDIDTELELIRLHDRLDIAFVELVDCNEHRTTRLYRDGEGGWSPVRSRAW